MNENMGNFHRSIELTEIELGIFPQINVSILPVQFVLMYHNQRTYHFMTRCIQIITTNRFRIAL